jgi:hypothetical protein
VQDRVRPPPLPALPSTSTAALLLDRATNNKTDCASGKRTRRNLLENSAAAVLLLS